MSKAEQLLKVGVVFGGMSAEHEVSWRSARNVVASLDPGRVEPVFLLIDKRGSWFLLKPEEFGSDEFLGRQNRGLLPSERRVLLDPEPGRLGLILKGEKEVLHTLDVVFPLVHGPYGEDGTLQGLCKVYQVPFVGPGVTASANCMDKDVMKRLLLESKIPVPRFRVLSGRAWRQGPDLRPLVEEIGLPLFVKPANLGSSVGISKVKSADRLPEALSLAFLFDDKVVIEEFIAGREIECSVLGNEDPIASLPGEIIPAGKHEFYSYDAKYRDDQGAELRVPADLAPEVAARVQQLALRSFAALGCEGMSRVDFFLREDGAVLVNELNTIPGFTNISMYPKLLEASGISNRELVHRLIELGLERFQRESRHSCNWDAVLPSAG